MLLVRVAGSYHIRIETSVKTADDGTKSIQVEFRVVDAALPEGRNLRGSFNDLAEAITMTRQCYQIEQAAQAAIKADVATWRKEESS